jgi:hypothetical protein
MEHVNHPTNTERTHERCERQEVADGEEQKTTNRGNQEHQIELCRANLKTLKINLVEITKEMKRISNSKQVIFSEKTTITIARLTKEDQKAIANHLQNTYPQLIIRNKNSETAAELNDISSRTLIIENCLMNEEELRDCLLDFGELDNIRFFVNKRNDKRMAQVIMKGHETAALISESAKHMFDEAGNLMYCSKLRKEPKHMPTILARNVPAQFTEASLALEMEKLSIEKWKILKSRNREDDSFRTKTMICYFQEGGKAEEVANTKVPMRGHMISFGPVSYGGPCYKCHNKIHECKCYTKTPETKELSRLAPSHPSNETPIETDESHGIENILPKSPRSPTVAKSETLTEISNNSEQLALMEKTDQTVEDTDMTMNSSVPKENDPDQDNRAYVDGAIKGIKHELQTFKEEMIYLLSERTLPDQLELMESYAPVPRRARTQKTIDYMKRDKEALGLRSRKGTNTRKMTTLANLIAQISNELINKAEENRMTWA